MLSFYEKLRIMCEKKGFSVSNLPQYIPELNITKASISGWKHGSTPRPRIVELIAEYFNVPIEYLTEDKENTPVKVPVYGTIAAGIPIEAIQDIVDYEELPSAMAKGGEYFALQVRGNSMEPRICSGDVVILRKQDSCDSGQIAAVIVNGNEATLKKVIYRNNGISLIPFNPSYPIQNYTNDDVSRLNIHIIGVAKEIRGKL